MYYSIHITLIFIYILFSVCFELFFYNVLSRFEQFLYLFCYFEFDYAVMAGLVAETTKYVVPKRFESRNLEEALMAGTRFYPVISDCVPVDHFIEWKND